MPDPPLDLAKDVFDVCHQGVPDTEADFLGFPSRHWELVVLSYGRLGLSAQAFYRTF